MISSQASSSKNKISIESLVRNTITILVLLLSLFFAPFYFEGDQLGYNNAYDGIKGSNVLEGYVLYNFYITSDEPIHFFILWIFSNLGIAKYVVMAFANAVLANVLTRMFFKWKVSIFVTCFIIFTNFYLLVLYFAAERLKFAFIFFFIAILLSDHVKRSYMFVLLSIVTHVQMLILVLGQFFAMVMQYLIAFLLTLKLKLSFGRIIFIIILFIPVIFLSDHILYKFKSYADISASKSLVSNTFQPIIFLLLSLVYSNNKKETFFIFFIVILSSSIVGPERITMIAYLYFMFYALRINRGINFGVIITSIYFFFKSIIFISNVIQNGHGF